jgi:hypothetical protein
MNRRLSPRLEVVFLMPSQKYTYLNSTLVKEVARLGGDVKDLGPRLGAERLRERLRQVTSRPARAAVRTPVRRPARAPGRKPA